MEKVNSNGTHDFYVGKEDLNEIKYYNIVPCGAPAPQGGFYDAEYILKVKGYTKESDKLLLSVEPKNDYCIVSKGLEKFWDSVDKKFKRITKQEEMTCDTREYLENELKTYPQLKGCYILTHKNMKFQ